MKRVEIWTGSITTAFFAPLGFARRRGQWPTGLGLAAARAIETKAGLTISEDDVPIGFCGCFCVTRIYGGGLPASSLVVRR